jgi:hypothetical protein
MANTCSSVYSLTNPCMVWKHDSHHSNAADCNVNSDIHKIMQTADASVLCIPYDVQDSVGPNSELSDKPKDVMPEFTFLKRYVSIHNRSTFMYLQVLIYFNEPCDSSIDTTKYIFRAKWHAMYKGTLQVEDSTMSGSFMYSHRDVPVDRLCNMLSRMSGHYVSACWKASNMGRRGLNTEPIRCMHVECSSEGQGQDL